MEYSKNEVMQYVTEEDVKFIRMAFCDIYGRQKNVSVMPQELNRAFEYGIAIDASAIAGFGGEVRLITGAPKLLGMVEGARGCDAAIFLGYHAMAGTEKAVLDHTFDQHTIYGLAINGRKMGETGVNALLCGALGVPVIMVSGDDALCLEAGSLLGRQLETCSVKEGLGRAAALCLTPESSAELIRSGVKRAVERLKKGEFAPFTPAAPYLLEVTLMNTLQTDAASLVPGAVRTAARTLRFETEDALELRRFLYSLMECATATLSSY